MVKVWIYREEEATDAKGKLSVRRIYLCECGAFRVRRGMRKHLKEKHGLDEEKIKCALEFAEHKVF